MPLLERADSVLIVVDVQRGFYPASADVDREHLELVIARAAWLAGTASALEIPVVVTEEDPARNGRTAAEVLAQLPEGTAVLEKPAFGLADCPEILAAVGDTGRRTAVIAGLETDVCVAHSAIGLLDRGFRVAVVVDATFAPGRMHDHGLRRMERSGLELVHAKGVYYEWVRTLEAARAFETSRPDLASPPGFSL
jgi:nicotinamidase-related amidase